MSCFITFHLVSLSNIFFLIKLITYFQFYPTFYKEFSATKKHKNNVTHSLLPVMHTDCCWMTTETLKARLLLFSINIFIYISTNKKRF